VTSFILINLPNSSFPGQYYLKILSVEVSTTLKMISI